MYINMCTYMYVYTHTKLADMILDLLIVLHISTMHGPEDQCGECKLGR